MFRRTCQLIAPLVMFVPVLVQAQGTTVWSRFDSGIGSSDLNWAHVAVADNGTVAACAKEELTSSTFLVEGWNPDGSFKFIYRYPDPALLYDEGAVDIVSDGNEFVIVGYTNHGIASGKTQTLVVRLDSSGNPLSEQIYDLCPGNNERRAASRCSASR